MDKNIEKTLKEFSKRNEIELDLYNSVRKADTIYTDKYIGKDVFLDNLMEWLMICKKNEDRDTFLELLSHYNYFTKERYELAIHNILEKIKKEGIEIENTLFVTFPSRRGTSSGGDFIRSHLVIDIMYGGYKEHIIADVEKATESIKKEIENIEAIVFIDDIIGSGMTCFGNIYDFWERFKFDKSYRIFIAAICANEKKVKAKIKQLKRKTNMGDINYIIIHKTKKALSEEKIVGDEEKHRICYYEKLIDSNSISDTDLDCVMGFKKGEQLVSFYYNTPNNTLSIFWKPSKISIPLFMRSSHRRLSIDECKKNKDKMKKNAYERGRMLNHD